MPNNMPGSIRPETVRLLADITTKVANGGITHNELESLAKRSNPFSKPIVITLPHKKVSHTNDILHQLRIWDGTHFYRISSGNVESSPTGSKMLLSIIGRREELLILAQFVALNFGLKHANMVASDDSKLDLWR